MRFSSLKQISFASLLLAVLLFISCNKNTPYTTISGFTQGTTYKVKYQSNNYELFDKEIEQILSNFDLSLSTYIDSSEVSKWNNNTIPFSSDTLLINVVKKASEVSSSTKGVLDITVSPLIKLWGFYSDSLPEADTSKIDSVLNHVDYKKIAIKENKIKKKDSLVSIDLNAIAQGYAVDILSNFLNSKNIKNYLVEIGGEIKTKGLNEYNSKWIIGIDKPVDDNKVKGHKGLQAKIAISDAALATSGNYRNFYIKNGKKYSHTINPETGYPVRHNLLSASIISKSCMEADAFATACMVMGIEKSIKLCDSLENIEGYFIFQNKRNEIEAYYTEGFKKYILN